MLHAAENTTHFVKHVVHFHRKHFFRMRGQHKSGIDTIDFLEGLMMCVFAVALIVGVKSDNNDIFTILPPYQCYFMFFSAAKEKENIP